MTNINNLISKHQKAVANFEFPKKDREFTKLEDLYKQNPNAKHTILAIFINKNSKFGDGTQGLFVTENNQVNLPHHVTDMVKELREDQEVIEAINNRQLAFEVYEYNGKNGKGYSINLTPSEQPTEDDTKGRAFNNDDSPAF